LRHLLIRQRRYRQTRARRRRTRDPRGDRCRARHETLHLARSRQPKETRSAGGKSMMRYVALAAVCVVLLHGCAKDLSAFVLVPDAEGRVGEATSTNKAGTVVLANDRDSTWVRNENTQ